jgi:isopentenyl-diphosphate delta-isomerase
MSNIEEQVILVDEQDNELGTMGKLEVHQQGILHRAISVFIFNDQRELLLHQRASTKYHSGGLWTNTCCSHPRPGEKVEDAAVRRLNEEMGLVCSLTKAFDFTYRAQLDGGLTEHELDHVFIGYTSATPQPDPVEVMDWKWIGIHDLQNTLHKSPENFTAWFRLIAERIFQTVTDRES